MYLYNVLLKEILITITFHVYIITMTFIDLCNLYKNCYEN